MKNELTIDDLAKIVESLEHTRHKFENYEYPSYEIKQERIKEVNEVLAKVKALKIELKKGNRA